MNWRVVMDRNTVFRPAKRGLLSHIRRFLNGFKDLGILMLVVLLSVSSGSAQAGDCDEGKGKGKNELEGVWQLESGKYTTPGGTKEVTAADFQQIKVITGTHWIVLGQELIRAKFVEGGSDTEVLAAAKSFFAGGGRYAIEGDTYTEHPEFFNNPNWVGQSIQFKYEMQGPDRWIQSGTFPLKKMGLAEDDTESVEVWKRIE